MKITHLNPVYTRTQLIVSDTLEYYDSGMTKILVHSISHNFLTGDYVTLTSTPNASTTFTNRVQVTVIDEDNFTFDALPNISLNFDTVGYGKRNYYIYTDEDYNVITKKLNVFTLKVTDGFFHSFVGSNKAYGNIEEIINENYYKKDIDRYKKRCVGDYVTCDCFLHKAIGIDKFMYRYIIDPNIENICDRYIWFNKTTPITGRTTDTVFHMPTSSTISYETTQVKLGGGVIDGESEIYETAKITNKRTVNPDISTGNGMLVVPVNYNNGNDLKNYLYWVFDTDDEESCNIMKYLLESWKTTTFFSKDERFYKENFEWEECEDKYYDYIGVSLPDPCWQYEGLVYDIGGTYYKCKRSGSVTLINDTTFTKDVGDIFIDFPIAQEFSTDTFKELKFNEYYIDNVIDENRNDIIDYEKVQFTPMLIDSTDSFDIDDVDDSLFKQVNEIEFNLHFLKRDSEEIEVSYGNVEAGFTNYTYYDYGDWPNGKKEGEYWNMTSISAPDDDGNQKIGYNEGQTEYYSDLIGDLGFYDDDVFYQKARLQNSFLRLLFYDSRNSTSQTLMFYANVYFDTNNLYNKYVKILAQNNTGKTDDSKYVYENFTDSDGNPDEDLRLSSRFTIKSKYDSTNSSEGFYIYTYPSIVDGSKLTPLYMKVQFNHAKYGSTTGLYMPTDDKGIPSDLIIKDGETSTLNPDFPLNYMQDPDTAATSLDMTEANEIDMERVLMDSYIKVYVKYDFKHKQYIWFLPRTTGEDSKHIVKDDGKIIFNLFEPKIKNTGDDKLTT